MQNLARREMHLEHGVRCAMAAGVRTGVRSNGTPARSASTASSAPASRLSVTSTHGNVAREHPLRITSTRTSRHQALEEADLALAEHQHAPVPQVSVVARQREAGLLDVGDS